MTPEREAEIRAELADTETCPACGEYHALCAVDLLAALDAERAAVTYMKRQIEARAERDELRERVATLQQGLTMGLEMKREPSPNPGAVEAIEFVLRTGRELGLWEE